MSRSLSRYPAVVSESAGSYCKFSQNRQGRERKLQNGGGGIVDLYLPKLLVRFDSMQPEWRGAARLVQTSPGLVWCGVDREMGMRVLQATHIR